MESRPDGVLLLSGCQCIRPCTYDARRIGKKSTRSLQGSLRHLLIYMCWPERPIVAHVPVFSEYQGDFLSALKKLITTLQARGFIRMRCIWATSLELAWGVFSLRRKIDNVREWVYDRVKPELARWIETARGLPIPRASLVHEMSVVEKVAKDTSQRRHSEGQSLISCQDTQSINRSNAPSPTSCRSKCSSQHRVERCKVEDKAMRDRNLSKKARSGQEGSDTEEEDSGAENGDDDEEDEGYSSPCKKKRVSEKLDGEYYNDHEEDEDLLRHLSSLCLSKRTKGR